MAPIILRSSKIGLKRIERLRAQRFLAEFDYPQAFKAVLIVTNRKVPDNEAPKVRTPSSSPFSGWIVPSPHGGRYHPLIGGSVMYVANENGYLQQSVFRVA